MAGVGVLESGGDKIVGRAGCVGAVCFGGEEEGEGVVDQGFDPAILLIKMGWVVGCGVGLGK